MTRSPALPPAHAGAERGDLARALEPEDRRSRPAAAGTSPALQEIRAVHRACAHGEPHLARVQLGIGSFSEMEHRLVAGLVEQDRLHRARS